MMLGDESFTTAMKAGGREAERAGRRPMGSEHLLLGLLTARGPLLAPLVDVEPRLGEAAVREAVERSLDDQPYLRQLGIDPDAVLASASAEGTASEGRRLTTGGHTDDLQDALYAAACKWHELRASGALRRERKVSAAVLWLAVLEPTTRVSRLLPAMGVDVDRLRAVVLTELAADRAQTPAWPEKARPGRVDRLLDRLFRRHELAG
ncbi:Clp protease N-terminal domain-containing protein [Pseudokineococcus sp. 1T1Z-3]|uniref:Clp protease N-terminal domain-containing protein n=1 Tax=Pseudokineococcus sp. 1T1Z-3 TaxID=3132745 RepID=UPI0030B0A383